MSLGFIREFLRMFMPKTRNGTITRPYPWPPPPPRKDWEPLRAKYMFPVAILRREVLLGLKNISLPPDVTHFEIRVPDTQNPIITALGEPVGRFVIESKEDARGA